MMVVIFVSCANVPQSSNRTTETATFIRYADVNSTEIIVNKIYQTPYTVDLNISNKKMTGEAAGSLDEFTETQLKQLAILDAVTKADADILIQPNFEITKQIESKTERIDNASGTFTIKKTETGFMTVTVSGYPASYSSFRQMTHTDAEIQVMLK